MNTRNVMRMALLVIALGVGTYGFGWWSVPLIAFVWGMLDRSERAARRAGFAAVLAWVFLLVGPALMGAPTWQLGSELASAMNLPAAVLWLVMVVYPFAAGWSGAAVGAAVRAPLRVEAGSNPAS